ncbi:DUF7132 family protein [Methanothermococcus okinawensis]|uniref:Uncharacterized protein n=1 Tax=Methanothermococcus okinawensis (strain DSM 14208 / JCM 11175 / IH1) TaxID=647113 RepID=F8AJJ3_METOI|nr:hypothetical protein [Methanothermococcus okinawensis]AEH07179.1 hypothetical protein Metok_1211 [Methanothermococcus okinawensis IH1]
MKTLESKSLELKKVITKSGAELYVIELSDNHFFIEQNPLKKSKYGVAYSKLKEKYPEYYMFWEIKNNKYTGKLLTGALLKKEDIDPFITEILNDEEYKEYEDVKENIEDYR